MANKRQRPVDTLQDQRPSRTRSAPVVPDHIEDAGLPKVLTGGEFTVKAPPAPANILGITREWWKLVWASPLRDYLISADIILVRRYFEYLDTRERAFREYRKEPTGIGSTKQVTVSHHWGVVKDAEKMCQDLEEALGIGPQARMRLGIAFADAVTKWNEMYERAVKPKGSDGAPGEMVSDDD